MNRYQDIIGKVNYGIFLATVALLPFPQILLRYMCVLWIIAWLLEGRWLSKPLSLRENKIAIPFILFGLWYIWKIVSGLWASDYDAWAWQMERYIAFGMIIPVGIWGVNKHYDWRMMAKVLIVSCICAIPIYLVCFAIIFHHHELIDFMQNKDEWDFSFTTFLPFFSSNISYIKHRLFLCSVELLGAVMAIYTMRNRWWLLLPSLAIMLSSIWLTGSRQSVLSCVALGICMLILSLPRRDQLRYSVGVLLFGAALGYCLLIFHPRMKDVKLTDFTEMRHVSYNHDVRFNIWGCALQQPSDYIWHGLGAGQSTRYMVEQYKKQNFDYYVYKHYHCHNQYLEETMEIGIFGMLLFVIAWLSIPFCAKGRGRHTAILFVILFMLNMFTDCMFGRFCGIALWAAGLMIIFLQSHAQRNEQTARDTQTH